MKRESEKRPWRLGLVLGALILTILGVMLGVFRSEPKSGLTNPTAPQPESRTGGPRRDEVVVPAAPDSVTEKARHPFVVVRDEKGAPIPGAPVVVGVLTSPLPRRLWTGETDSAGLILRAPLDDVLDQAFLDADGASVVVALDMIGQAPVIRRIDATSREETIELVAPAVGHLRVNLDRGLASPSLEGLVRLAVGLSWSELGERPSSQAHRLISGFRPWTGSPWTLWVAPDLPLRATLLVDGAHVTETFPGPGAGREITRTFSPDWRLLVAQLEGVDDWTDLQGRLKVPLTSAEERTVSFHPTPDGRVALALDAAMTHGTHRDFAFEVHHRWNTESVLARGETSHDGHIDEGVLDLGHISLSLLPILLEGRVILEDRSPVPQAMIKTLRRGMTGSPQGGETLARTDGDGRYVIRGRPLSLGEGLVVSKEGYVPEIVEGFREGATGLLTILRRGGEIRGRLGANGALPDGVTIEVWSGDRLVAVQRAAGKTFSFRGLAPGTYTLRVVAKGREIGRIEGITMAPGQAADDPRLHPVALNGLSPAGLKILSQEGIPLADRDVTVRSSEGMDLFIRGRTNAKGELDLALPDLDSPLWVQVDGFLRQRVKLGATRTSIILKTLVPIEIRVTNPERIPARPSLLYADLRDRNSDRHVRKLLEARRTTLSAPGPGVYELRLLVGEMGFGKTPRAMAGFRKVITVEGSNQVVTIEIPH